MKMGQAALLCCSLRRPSSYTGPHMPITALVGRTAPESERNCDSSSPRFAKAEAGSVCARIRVGADGGVESLLPSSHSCTRPFVPPMSEMSKWGIVAVTKPLICCLLSVPHFKFNISTAWHATFLYAWLGTISTETLTPHIFYAA